MKLRFRIFVMAAATSISIWTLSACKKQSPPAEEKTAEVEETVPANCLPNGTYQAKGTFNGKYAFTMHFAVKDDKVAGHYYYDKYKTHILITGEISPEGIKLQEYTDGKNTGDFKGVVDTNREYRGIFTNHLNDKTLDYVVKVEEETEPKLTIDQYFFAVEGLSPYDTSEGYASSNSDPNDNEASSSEDWDELISSYSRYMDQVIRLYQKAAKGDTSAMTEYSELLGEAQDLCDKLEAAKDKMTAKQVERLNKVVLEKTAALSKLQ